MYISFFFARKANVRKEEEEEEKKKKKKKKKNMVKLNMVCVWCKCICSYSSQIHYYAFH